MALEVSAFLSAKVPPKPQHSSAPGSSTSSRSATPARSRVVGHPLREGGADVDEAEPVGEELAQLEEARRQLRRVPLERGVAQTARESRITLPDRADTGGRRRHDRLVGREESN
jgi:hypothetical protein